MTEFIYTPLQDPDIDLRVLEVLPPSDDDDGIINCRLKTADMIDRLVYRAISYTWGDETLKVQILINQEIFYVTPNLEKVLRQLQTRKWQTRYYWIDAICINQKDHSERLHQVQRMKDIYREALEVVIWLGSDHEEEDDKIYFRPDFWGFERLERGTRETTVLAVELILQLAHYNPDTQLSIAPNFIHNFPERGSPRSWACISRIFRRVWFERLWVIQELENARRATVWIGDATIEWDQLERAATFILRPPQDISQSERRLLPLLGIERLQNVGLVEVDRSNILTILRQTRNAKCKDPRDR